MYFTIQFVFRCPLADTFPTVDPQVLLNSDVLLFARFHLPFAPDLIKKHRFDSSLLVVTPLRGTSWAQFSSAQLCVVSAFTCYYLANCSLHSLLSAANNRLSLLCVAFSFSYASLIPPLFGCLQEPYPGDKKWEWEEERR